MNSGNKRVGYKLSNALISPRLLRHRDVTLLAEDVFSDDFASLSINERKQLTRKTNSCGSMNTTPTNMFSSPSLGRAATRLSKMVPRKVSLSSLMPRSQLKKQTASERHDELKARGENGFRNQLVSEPVPTIQLHSASSSESVGSEYAAGDGFSSSVKFGLSESEAESEAFSDDSCGFTEELPSPFSSSPPTPQPYWDRRHSEAVLNHQVASQPCRRLPPKNSSSPQILPSTTGDQTRSTQTSVRVRRKPVTERDNPLRAVLRQKVDNFDNYCSDSEITVKVPKSDHPLRLNSSFSTRSENFRPDNLPLHHSLTYKNHAAYNSIQRDVSKKDLPVSSEPNRRLSSGDPRSSPTTAKPSSLTSRASDSNIPSHQIKSRRDFLSLTDTVPDSTSPQDFKRAKSYFNVSPSLQRRSPAHGRRKSPYKELSSGGLDPDSNRVQHLPPKSPSKLQTPKSSANRHSAPLARCVSEEEVKPRKKQSHNKFPRRSIATEGWHSASIMLTNYQYAGHYHDESENSSTRNRNQAPAPGHNSEKSFDAALFDVLKIPPDEYAKQLTLLDLPVFVAITPDEITGSGWTKKDKWKLSPNVCEMTQRFNNTSFWCIREVLHAATLKIRAEIMTHFIKIAKRLYELNNLHSLMAVIQSLNSSSIIRLTTTWALISKSNKSTFDRLLNLVKIDDNRSELRAHMEGIKLPCIPFLGMYLADVIYIDSAHPSTGGMESQERKDKMNNVLRILAAFQQSCYDHLQEKPHIKNYLNSVKYIEELERFLEEDNYKLSLKIEPPVASVSPEKRTLQMSKDDMSAGSSGRQASPTPPVEDRFALGHRKSRSLGKEYNFPPMSATRTKSDTCRNVKSGGLHASVPSVPAITTSLLDDSIIAPCSFPSASSSTSHISHPLRNSLSAESTRSATGSEYSEANDPSGTSEKFFKYWSLPKYKTPTQWFKVYYGNRGKYSLRPMKGSDQTEEQRSSTYPIAKNSTLRQVYQSYLTNSGFESRIGEESGSSAFSDIEEFAKMRVEEGKASGSDVKNCDIRVDYCSDDDEMTLIENQISIPHEKKLNPTTNKSQADALGKVYGSISNLSLQVAGQAKALKQYFMSPTANRKMQKEGTSDMTLPDSPENVNVDVLVDLSPNRIRSLSVGKCKHWEYSISETAESELEFPVEQRQTCEYEGPLKRKCVMKHGKKPSMSSWTRYWVSLYGCTLAYYSAKSITNKSERHHFKSRPYKSVSILGWMVLQSSDSNKLDSFQLSDPDKGAMYRFQCDSEEIAKTWIKVLEQASKGPPKPEKDLINLDES